MAIKIPGNVDFIRFFRPDHISRKEGDSHVKGICNEWGFVARSVCKSK